MRCRSWPLWAFFGAAAALVTFPLAKPGHLLLLDWAPGPHMPFPKNFLGLEGGLQASLPLSLGVVALARLFGPGPLGWLTLTAVVVIGGVGAARLVDGQGATNIAAGLLYVVNPVVYERAYVGQFGFLLAYGLLPWAVRSIVRSRHETGWSRLRPALWVVVLAGFGLHFLFISALVVFACLLWGRLARTTLVWAGALFLAVALCSAYVFVPMAGRTGPVSVGLRDLVAFRTSGDARLGLFANVAALYGFWREEPPLPKGDVPGWPFFMAAILLVALAGAYRSWRIPERRELLAVVGIAGAFGYFLALGDQGPTGPVFRWLFLHLPGFAIMREPQKFVALVALAYAVMFGFGAEALVSGVQHHWRRIAAGVAAAALPLCYTPTLFFGLSGRISVSHYPSSWSGADRLMGDGVGKALFLPWHQYLSFPFTGRTAANPADVAFRRDVIFGDNVELRTVPTASRSPRSAYLEFLYRSGSGLCSFGDLVAPLGVEFVMLARTVDWQNFTWLDRQVDLIKVFDSPELVVYRNLRFSGIGWRSGATREAENWAEVVELSRDAVLSNNAVVVANTDPRQPAASQSDCRPPSEVDPSELRLTRRSPVTYEVAPGRPGMVVLSEPFDPTWRLDGQRPVQLAGGVTGLPAPAQQATIKFGHWNRVRLGYAISGFAVVALLIGPVAGRRRSKATD